ncbi:hypothetical protein NHQ30_002965 [Ciborinia camelliae]|nr:hypothetical protein NHQ30_002965 [Ciborinia camelliae]
MNVNLEFVWGELLRSNADNETVLRGLLEGRPEIEKAKDLNYMFVNYLSIIHNIFTTKMGGGWIDPKEFYAESLLEVDKHCHRWWALADMRPFGQATMPPPLSPTEEITSLFDALEAPPTPELSFTENQSPSTASSGFCYPSATASFNKHQITNEFPLIWDDVVEPGFVLPFTPLGGFDKKFSNGRGDFGSSVVQQPKTNMPRTPRLEQQGFVPSPNPSLAVQTSANKQNGHFQPMPPPARKIAIPRLQKLGSFEPLIPPTQDLILQSAPAIGQASISVPPKRRYTKVSAETLSDRRRKRQAVGSEKPKPNPVSIEYELSTPGSEYSPGTLINGSPGSALGQFSRESYNANHSTLTGFNNFNSNALVPSSNRSAITSQKDWNDTVSVAFNSNPGAGSTGLGISGPPMNHGDFTNFEELIPTLHMDMNTGHRGTGTTAQNTIPFDISMHSAPMHSFPMHPPPMHPSSMHPSPMHSSSMSARNSNGKSHQMAQHMYNNVAEMDNVLGMDQFLGDGQPNAFHSWYA